MNEETTPTEPQAQPNVAAEAAETSTTVAGVSSSQEEMSDDARARRKVRQGLVLSNKMDKTIVVAVQRKVTHPLYKKFINKTSKFVAHDETNDANIGDLVRIMETRPLSKTKRWRLVTVLERAK